MKISKEAKSSQSKANYQSWRMGSIKRPNSECVLCHAQHLETRDHLFFQCNFSVRIWAYLQIDWCQGSDMIQIAKSAKQSFNQPFFAEVVFTAWWNIWMIRNDKWFRHVRPSFAKWRVGFVHDLTLLSYRIKPRLKDQLLR